MIYVKHRRKMLIFKVNLSYCMEIVDYYGELLQF